MDAIITMTQALQLTTVVEGIETEQEHKFFMKRKCDRFQGYLFARPKTLESMLE